MKSVRIYGFTKDFGSYAQVTRGFGEGLSVLGRPPEDQPDVVSLEDEISFDEEPTGNPLADVAILTGPPIAAGKLTRGVRHERRFVMVAPNSDKLPERTMHTVNQHATELLAPSKWGAGVLRDYTNHPVHVVPHGISEEFRPESARLGDHSMPDEFRVLHLSSTDGQRKGTEELCRGFAAALLQKLIPSTSTLTLALSGGARGQMLDMLMDLEIRERVKIIGRFDMVGVSPQKMSKIYSWAHVVCQPSRGEGFGLVPLEALACGVPIVATACTGHSEWFTTEVAGAITVPTGKPEPIDDMPDARAPSLRVEDVAGALGVAYASWPALKAQAMAQAPELSRRWSWRQSLLEFAEMVRA